MNETDKRETPRIVTPAGWLHPVELDEYLEMPDPKIRWLVKGLVPVSSLVMVSGARKRARKTYLAFLIALLLTYQESYWEWTAEEAANVLILEEESIPAENKQRFRNLKMGLNLDGKKKLGKLYFQLHARYKFDNPKMVHDLIAFVKTNDIRLVIFDALTYMISGDPNNTRDMGLVTGAIQDIRAATGSALLWLAHTNKEADKVDADPDNDVRNSSILADIYDAHVALRFRKENEEVITAILRFKAWAEKRLTIYWNFPPELPDGSYAQGPIFPDVQNVTGDRRAADAVTRLVQGGWIPGVVYPMAAFRVATGLNSGAAATLRAQLIEQGKLILGPDGQGVGLPGGKNGGVQGVPKNPTPQS